MYEKSTILSNLAERAQLVHKELNDIPGVTCSQLEGAMYAFPQVMKYWFPLLHSSKSKYAMHICVTCHVKDECFSFITEMNFSVIIFI